MQIKDMFRKKIDREIQGVIIVGQGEETNVAQELEEYVVTRELQRHFADFFADQSNCAERKNSKHITIFTKDHKSRFQILEQLRSMNGGRTERLQNDNDFKIIMTDNPNKVLIKKFFDHLKEESLDAHYNMMRRIRLMVL